MEYQVTLRSGVYTKTQTFTTKADQRAAMDLLYFAVRDSVEVSSDDVVPALEGWVPDAGDLIAITSLMARYDQSPPRLVSAIRYVRQRSGVSLRMAKDWVQENFGGV